MSRFERQSAKSRKELVFRAVSLALLFTFIVFLRHPGQFLHPQFWTEGSLLYSYSLVTPKFQFLFQELTGYLLLPQRAIVVLVTTFFPAALHPAVCVALSVALLVSLLCYFSLTPSRLPSAPLFAIGVLLSPLYGAEVYAKLLYLMWVLPLAYFFILFRDSDRLAPRLWIADAFCLVAAGLSGPLVLLFVPAMLCVTLIRRSMYFVYMLATTLFTAAVQLYYLSNYPSSAVRSCFSPDLLQKTVAALFSVYLPKYFAANWLPSPWIGAAFFLLLLLAVLVSRREAGKDCAVLCVLFFSTAIPPLLKLYPNAVWLLDPIDSGSSRYLFFPNLAITFLLLLLVCKSKPRIRVAASLALVVACLVHLPGFQAVSLDYQWAQHLRLAASRNCSARVPVPYTGGEGITWLYKTGPTAAETCTDVTLRDWAGGASEQVTALGAGKLSLQTRAAKGIISVPPVLLQREQTFVNFSLILESKGTRPKLGIKFYDAADQSLKDVSDLIYHSVETSVVAEVPQGGVSFRPYVQIKRYSKVEISDASVLIFR